MSQRALSNPYVSLYEDALKRKEKEAAPVEYTFTPSLTVFNPGMFKDVEKPSKKTVVQVKEDIECTFVPRINSVSNSVRNRRQGYETVSDYLHNSKKKGNLISDEAKCKEVSKNKYTSERSAQLLEKTARRKLAEIFDMLDSDKDGLISPPKMDLTHIPPKITNILNPFLSNMKEQEMSAEIFEILAYEYYMSLSSFDKDVIIEFNRKLRADEKPEKPSFVVILFTQS